MLLTRLGYRITLEAQRFLVKMVIIFPCLSQKHEILAHHTDKLPLCLESGDKYKYPQPISGKLALNWLCCYLEQVDGNPTVPRFPVLISQGFSSPGVLTYLQSTEHLSSPKNSCVKLDGRGPWDTTKTLKLSIPFQVCYRDLTLDANTSLPCFPYAV